MPSLKDLKKRISSVKNTQQTTKAMKMVAAAKLRRSQDAIFSHRPFAKQIGSMIKKVSNLPGVAHTSPLTSAPAVEGKKKVLLLLVTSDRGLCGGFNSSVIKKAERWTAEKQSQYARIGYAFIGKKAHDFFKFRGSKDIVFAQDFGPKATYANAQAACSRLIELFTSGEFDEIKVIYNEFKNAISQIINVDDFLPLSGAQYQELTGGTHESEAASSAEGANAIVRPSPQELLEALLEKHFGIQLFRIILESQASEHGARMAAMENATKNAGEMIRAITLQYNKLRQSAITKEILEITSGSEALK